VRSGLGAFDFTCLHAHCRDRGWRDFRAADGAGPMTDLLTTAATLD
jgi:hypothetical protein